MSGAFSSAYSDAYDIGSAMQPPSGGNPPTGSVTVIVNTMPYCGECGWDTRENVHDDERCDACGADLALYGYVKP